ncbi:hypothetical protein [Streptomyces sp. N1]|uniref:hypothetical protein n=1 Tax=Streptomyces sp. N1 TaxID=576456 RepID=UPI0010105DDF|nr:hypothetical protein [Streptomyces sp. N1]
MKRRLAVVGGLAAVMMTVSSGHAWAGTDGIVKTADDNPGGLVAYQYRDAQLSACDFQVDGYNVRGSVTRYSDGKSYGWVNTSGDKIGSCAAKKLSIPAGTKLAVSACLEKSGKFYFCRGTTAVA